MRIQTVDYKHTDTHTRLARRPESTLKGAVDLPTVLHDWISKDPPS